jgi:hypothetical protein
MMRKLFAAGALFAATLFAQPGGGTSCNRACLEGFVNQYLDALAAHNPFGLPLAPRIKFSENDQLLEFGDGAWNVVTGIGDYKFYVADPQAGQVALFDTLRENDAPVAFALRLKIENMRISEVESLVVRDGGAGAAVEALGKPDPLLLEAVPAGARLSRKALISAADSYWDAAETGNAANVPFAGCDGGARPPTDSCHGGRQVFGK